VVSGSETIHYRLNWVRYPMLRFAIPSFGLAAKCRTLEVVHVTFKFTMRVPGRSPSVPHTKQKHSA